ncbi:MAG: heavy-metal-associated domain-containing protein [Cryobacterium sp.]
MTGMTCGHCVGAVTEEISLIDGADAVSVELVVGGESLVTVSSAAPLDRALIEAAVTEAGYELVTARP